MSEKTFPGPSRSSLIAGAMLVALHGLQQCCIGEARRLGIEDWNQYGDYARCKEAIEAVKRGKRYETDDSRILDLMAHTQQTLRLGYEEWESVQLIFRKTPRNSAG